MATYKNIEGQRFGKLVAQRVVGKNKQGNYLWECLCDCGGSTIAASGNLHSGGTRACGCGRKDVPFYRSRERAIRSTGKLWNGIRIISLTSQGKGGLWKALCKCYCGNIFCLF